MIIFILVGFVLLFLLLTLGGIIAEHGEKNGLVKRGAPHDNYAAFLKAEKKIRKGKQ